MLFYRLYGVFERKTGGTDHIFQLATAAFSAGAEIWVQVGENSDNDSVFNPQMVAAVLGDIVYFNCAFAVLGWWAHFLTTRTVTKGNHTVTQSLFATPCIKANAANLTVNGFDSGFQNASTIDPGYRFSVPITAAIENTTQWFFDYNTCGDGGVGGINVNDSSWDTLDGFVVRVKVRTFDWICSRWLGSAQCRALERQ